MLQVQMQNLVGFRVIKYHEWHETEIFKSHTQNKLVQNINTHKFQASTPSLSWGLQNTCICPEDRMVQTRWGMEYPSRTLLLQELQGLESTPPALEQVWERESKDSEDQAR